MQLSHDEKIFWHHDWFVHVAKQANPPTMSITALRPVSMTYMTGQEVRNQHQGFQFVERLYASVEDATPISATNGITTIVIDSVSITLAPPALNAEQNLMAILRLTMLQTILNSPPLIDRIRIEFGFNPEFEPYGRSRYTCFSHPEFLDDNGIDYGLATNGATYTASSQYKDRGPNMLGVPGTGYLHFNNDGAKFLEWSIPVAKRIRSIQFYSGGNNTFNCDFLRRVRITLFREGLKVKSFVHTFQPVAHYSASLENYTPLEVLKL